MAFIAADVRSTKAVRTDLSDPYTFTHDPNLGGTTTPRAVVVAAIHGTSSTDHIDSITYGGVALTEQVRVADIAGEPGAAELWFLGTGIPTGSQTISVDLASATGDDILFVCITFAVDDDKDAAVHATAQSANEVANPSVTPAKGGNVAVGVSCIYTGSGTPLVPAAGLTSLQTHDFTSFGGTVARETSVTSSTDQAHTYTLAAGDDTALVAMTIKEVAGAVVIPPDELIQRMPTMSRAFSW